MGDILYIEPCERILVIILVITSLHIIITSLNILVIILVITLSYYRYYYYFTLSRAELAIAFEILLQKIFELSKIFNNC